MNLYKKIHINRIDLILLCSLLFLIILFSPRQSVTTTYDAGLRLCEALRINKGIDLMWLKRGPVFPLLISLSFYLLGISIQSAFLVVRVFWALNIFLSFIFTKKLFDRWTAFIASLFIFASYGINITAESLTQDMVMPVFLMIFLLFFYRACEEKNRLYFVFSGFALGISFLTKETAILYLFFIALVYIHKEYRNKKILKENSYLLTSFLFSIGLWATYVYIQSHNFNLLLGAASSETVSHAIDEQGLVHFIYVNFVFKLFPNIFKSYTNIIAERSILAPFFPFVFLFLLISNVIYKRRNEFFLLLGISIFLPILVIIGARGDSIRQIIILLNLFYIGIAYFIVVISKWLTFKMQFSFVKKYPLLVFFLISLTFSLIIVSTQLFNGRIPTKKLLLSGPQRWHNILYSKAEFEVKGRHTKAIKEAGQWLQNNVTSGESILTSGSIFNTIEFFTEFAYKNNELRIFKTCKTINNDIKKGAYKNIDKILFIFPHQRFGDWSERHQDIYFIFEKDLLESIKKIGHSHLIISFKEAAFNLYLERTNWAKEVFKNEEVTIYRIYTYEIKSLDSFTSITSNLFKEKLEIFKINCPDKYEDFRNMLFYFGLKDEDLIEKSYENYQKKWVEDYIPKGARIAYSHGTGECEIIREGDYYLTKFNKDSKLDLWKRTNDYLFIHNSRIRKDEFPVLFKELELIEPYKVFPQLFYFGDGWTIYKIR